MPFSQSLPADSAGRLVRWRSGTTAAPSTARSTITRASVGACIGSLSRVMRRSEVGSVRLPLAPVVAAGSASVIRNGRYVALTVKPTDDRLWHPLQRAATSAHASLLGGKAEDKCSL